MRAKESNPSGSKVDFEAFFKSLQAEQKKVSRSYQSSLQMWCYLIWFFQVYDDQAKMAVGKWPCILYFVCHLTVTDSEHIKIGVPMAGDGRATYGMGLGMDGYAVVSCMPVDGYGYATAAGPGWGSCVIILMFIRVY